MSIAGLPGFLSKALAFLCVVCVCQGQFEPATSTSGLELAEAIKAKKKSEPGPANLRLGPVNFSFDAGLREEYNDNVMVSNQSREDDLITTPHIATRIYWPITSLNKLDLIVDLAYSKYMNHSDLDTQSLLVKPGSMLNFDFFVRDIHFNLHDRISIEQDPTTSTQVSNVGVFRRTSNTIGLGFEWDLNRLLLDGGFDYDTLSCSDSQFKSLDMSTSTFRVRVGYRAVSPLVLGVVSSYWKTEYDQSVQNNSSTYSEGVFGNMIFSEYLRGELEVDYQMSKYDTGGSIGDNSQFDSPVFSASLVNQLNRWYSHSMKIGRKTMAGVGSNFTETYNLDYDANVEIFRNIATSIGGFVEKYEDSGSESTVQTSTQTISQSISQAGDKGLRYGIRLQLSYQLFEAAHVGLGYQRTEKDSDFGTSSYDQNRVTIDMNYRF
jgi:hypothetical protein